MPGLYLSNDSYAELRGVQPRWARTATWWRAIRHALGHADFWVFVTVQLAGFAGYLAAGIALTALWDGPAAYTAATVLTAAWLGVLGYLQLSWGGDMMRRHLRAVSEVARYACPRCGQSLFGHLDGGDAVVRCPECAARVDRALFAPPYRVPREFRAFPPRRRDAAG